MMSASAAAAAGAILAPLAAPLPAQAIAPLAGKQTPSFYRYKLGDDEITVIHDGARTFPMPDTFVRNVSKDEALAAAEAAYMPKGMVTVPFNPTVINTGSKLVLIDSGYGAQYRTDRRAIASQSGSRRHRSEADRHRRAFSPAPGPH
jgi:hypothetical protein